MSTRVLCSFPGRYGDLLWALPSIRALSESLNQPVDLAIAGEFASIAPLLELQPYLGTIFPLADWTLTPPDAWISPRFDIARRYNLVIDLGYRGWPEPDCARATEAVLRSYGFDLAIDLTRPWITSIPAPPREDLAASVAVGFTEAYFETKLGILHAIGVVQHDCTLLTLPHSRWMTEAWGLDRSACGWVEAATAIRAARLFVGDCSALHVLAVACRQKVLLVEPMEARWNPIFYPLGMDGPQVQIVRGNDGRPTFDARAVATAILDVLAAVEA